MLTLYHHVTQLRALALTRRMILSGQNYSPHCLQSQYIIRRFRSWAYGPTVPTIRDYWHRERRTERVLNILKLVLGIYTSLLFNIQNLIMKLLAWMVASSSLNFVTDVIERRSFDESAWSKAAIRNLHPIVQPEDPVKLTEYFNKFFDIIKGLYGSKEQPRNLIEPRMLLQLMQSVVSVFKHGTVDAGVRGAMFEVLVVTYREVRAAVLESGERSDTEIAQRVNTLVLGCALSLFSLSCTVRLEQLALANKAYQEKKEKMREKLDTRYETVD